MMEQWQRAKSQHPDAILLFRMGDFYELFGNDAIIAAPILELTLTSRDKDKSGTKMAGFPFHAADSYVAKLIECGHKVAICDQLEDPKTSRGIVKRGITNVVTPGTAIGELSFLIGIASSAHETALCALDLATATFRVTSSPSPSRIIQEAIRISPKEIVVLRDDEHAVNIALQLASELKRLNPVRIEKREHLQNVHESYLSRVSLQGPESKAALLTLAYLSELKGRLPTHLDCPVRYSIDGQLLIDGATLTNLSLLPKKKGDRHNLFSVLDDTKTVMGKRALYQAISAPSTSMEEITARHEMVAELCNEAHLRSAIREMLISCYDIERLTALLASGKISPRGLGQLRDSLNSVGEMLKMVNGSQANCLKTQTSSTPDVADLLALLKEALVDEPPINLWDGGVFKKGFDEQLDELRSLITNSKELLLDLEARERKASGILSLKIRFTRVFGYYIEITKTHLDKVPKHYQRKQTIANGERFVTAELSELEAKMSSAEADAQAIEDKRFAELTERLAKSAPKLMQVGRQTALLDLLANFSELACVRNYAKPHMLHADERVVDITLGRHPIIEDILLASGSYFVPNDVVLSKDDCSLLLVTGPNMAGKSTIMRQVALIQIMAQIGCFVPAERARLSICDAIFARVGASDDLFTGRSTFMVEMTETAAILKNATAHSLILLDEIGRGTSTYDGLSIAQAVAEYIHNHLKARTLFATHYHELTKLERSLHGLRNFHVEIDDSGHEVRFLYTLKQGPCLQSFGIQVARISGLPLAVLTRASEVLSGLECYEDRNDTDVLVKANKRNQLDLFHKNANDQAPPMQHLVDKIMATDINRLTPLQALTKLAAWQNILKAAR